MSVPEFMLLPRLLNPFFGLETNEPKLRHVFRRVQIMPRKGSGGQSGIYGKAQTLYRVVEGFHLPKGFDSRNQPARLGGTKSSGRPRK
jgi:hypothetical protein